MARQMYESEEDRQKERAVIERVVGDKFHIKKLPINLRADFGLFDKNNGTLRWWAEVRCRNNIRDKYPTLFVGLEKILSMVELVNTTGKPLAFIADWTDSTGRFDFRQGDKIDDFHITWGGRNDLRDEQDVEPVMHIPTDRFVFIGRKP